MAKTTAPLLSFGANGQIAKSMVMSSWRGVPYARRYVVPANPNTQAQQLTRSVFKTLQQFFALAPGPVIAAFDLYATGRPFMGRNAFTSRNLAVLRDGDPENSMAGLITSPGARGGLPPAAIIADVVASDITVTLTLPQIPAGWTLTQAIAVAFIDQAATAEFGATIHSAVDAADPFEPVLLGLDPGDYVVSGFLQWEKPDGTTAYSRSLATTATVV